MNHLSRISLVIALDHGNAFFIQRVAFECAVDGGYGWIHLEVSFNQMIDLKLIGIEPPSDTHDGSFFIFGEKLKRSRLWASLSR